MSNHQDNQPITAHHQPPPPPPVVSANLNDYYESLRHNVISLLEHVRAPASSGSHPIPAINARLRGASSSSGPPPAPLDAMALNNTQFDNYLSKMQAMCAAGSSSPGSGSAVAMQEVGALAVHGGNQQPSTLVYR